MYCYLVLILHHNMVIYWKVFTATISVMFVGVDEVALLSGGGSGGLPGGAFDPGCSLLAGSGTLLGPLFPCRQPLSSAQPTPAPLGASSCPQKLFVIALPLLLSTSSPPERDTWTALASKRTVSLCIQRFDLYVFGRLFTFIKLLLVWFNDTDAAEQRDASTNDCIFTCEFLVRVWPNKNILYNL